MTRRLLSFVVVISIGAAAASAAPDERIGHCIDRLDAIDMPMAGVMQQCPDIREALAADAWAPSLPQEWAESFTSAMLEDLSWLQSSYPDGPLRWRAPDPGNLDNILAGLGGDAKPEQRLSIFDELRDWLKDTLERYFPGLWDRISDLFDQFEIPDLMTDNIAGAVYVLSIIVLAALVVSAIIYAQRRFRRRLAPGQSSRSRSPGQGTPAPLTVAQIEAAELRQRPRLLLRLLLQELSRRRQVTDPERLTHRELVEVSPFTRMQEARAFGSIVGLAEYATFGTWVPDEVQFRDAMANGEMLIRTLEAGTP